AAEPCCDSRLFHARLLPDLAVRQRPLAVRLLGDPARGGARAACRSPRPPLRPADRRLRRRNDLLLSGAPCRPGGPVSQASGDGVSIYLAILVAGFAV